MLECSTCGGEGIVPLTDEEELQLEDAEYYQVSGDEPSTMNPCPDCEGTGNRTAKAKALINNIEQLRDRSIRMIQAERTMRMSRDDSFEMIQTVLAGFFMGAMLLIITIMMFLF